MAAHAGQRFRGRRGKLPDGERDALIAFARHELGLAQRLPDGTTRRANLESVERQTGRRPAALDGPECPAWGEHVWHWWCELHRGRPSGGMGPAALTWADIAAWSRLMEVAPSRLELALIMEIDAVWLDLVQADLKASRP